MVSLAKVKAGGRTYWRIVESRRVNGKPRPVPILHLGTADALLERLLKAPEGQLRIRSFQHGDVAALKSAADRLGVEKIFDRHLQKLRKPKKRSLPVGQTLLLAAFNRAVQPGSKRAWSKWANGTSLHRLFLGLKPQDLTSQHFWDQMDCVPIEALKAMEEELTKAVVKRLGIQLDTLLYDTTNFFTFIASTNTRSKLTSRGHNKQKRHHQEPCASETAVCVYRRNGLDPAYLLAQRPTNPAVIPISPAGPKGGDTTGIKET